MNPQNIQFLKDLLSISGLSGFEDPIRGAIQKAWQPLTDEIQTGRLGSLQALKRGYEKRDNNLRILIEAHMDAIGMMVTKVTKDGFLRFTEIGGIRDAILPGQAVIVHGRKQLMGVIAKPPDNLLSKELLDKVTPMEYLLVDVGLEPDDVKKLVRSGDLISFAQEPMELLGGTITGHSLDNRASISALTICLKELQILKHTWDVWSVATTTEETNFGGAISSSFDIKPDVAIVVDVTFAKSTGTDEHSTYPLGKGVALGWGPNIHPGLFKSFKEIADQLEVPYIVDVMPAHSYTDAIPIQVTAEGVPTMLLSIPLRYMHNPVEVVSTKDIQRTGYLIAQFIAELDDNYMNKLNWDD